MAICKYSNKECPRWDNEKEKCLGPYNECKWIKSKSYLFDANKKIIIKGKSYYKDHITIDITPHRAFDLIQYLSKCLSDMMIVNKKENIFISFLGELEIDYEEEKINES